MWGFSTGRIVALSQGHNRKLCSHHQWWPWTRRFHHQRRADEVQYRRRCAATSGQLPGSWTQIWLRHGACPILLSESVGLSHNQLPPPQQCCWMVWCRSWWTSSWIRAACGSPCVFIIINWCATGLELGMPLKHLHTTQALVLGGLLNHCEGLCSTFPKIGTKSDAHLLFRSLIHRENCHRSRTWLQINMCENCPCPPSYMQFGTLTH